MFENKLKISSKVLLVISLTGLAGCSTFSKVGKSAQNIGGSQVVDVDEKLIIPPSLQQPTNTNVARQAQAPRQQAPRQQAQPSRQQTKPVRAASRDNGNFYIIVGTYPDQLDALDTFTRLSSIGLKGATMESRKTKAGSLLHMVRLGPYTEQEDIDQAKDSLTNTGLSQFKVVKN